MTDDINIDPSTGHPNVTVRPGTVKDGFSYRSGDPKDRKNWQKLPEVGQVEKGYKFNGGDPSDKGSWEKVQGFPGGMAGTVTAQAQGQLHGLSDTFGAPVDLVSAGMRKAGVPVGDEPFLGSKSIRRLMSVPGQAAGWLVDQAGGKGTAEQWGLGGHATYEDINEVPPSYRPQARMGQVLGETEGMLLPITAAAGMAAPAERLAAAAKPTGSAAKDLWRSTMADASKPGFTAKTMATGAGAGAGAYGAEAVVPGNENAQFVSQLIGGLAPAGIVGGTSSALSAAKKPLDPLLTTTPEGAKTVMARSLGKEFQKAGESPEAAVRNLKTKPVVPGASPAEQSGSPVMMGVEKTLSEANPELANTLAKRNAQFLGNIKTSLNEAFAPGERGALTRTAQAVGKQIDGLISTAENAATDAAMALGPNVKPEEASRQARQILEDALDTARKAETDLWRKVPKGLTVTTEATVDAFQRVKGEMLPEAGLPTLIERVMKRFMPEEEETAEGLLAGKAEKEEKPEPTLGDLQNLRSEVLNQARVARAGSDFNLARRLEIIGNGILSDMETVAGDSAKLARSFSRELNDRFSRSFAGDVLGLKESGATAVRPSVTLEAATSGKPQTVAEKLKELQIAATSIPKQIDASGNIVRSEQLSSEMRAVQEQFLQSLSSRFTDVSTGRVSTGKAANFLRDYAPVLEQFPLYKQKIDNALTAQLGSARISGMIEDVDRLAFARVIKAGEVPMTAVAKSLASPTPVLDFNDLSNLAKRGGEAAVGGLRATILDFVMDGSLARGNLSYGMARQKLVGALYPNGPSLIDLMKKNGIVDAKQAEAIVERLDAAVDHEMAGQKALRIDEVGDEAGKMARWGSRILGAKLASKLGFTHGGAGPSLQVAQIAASAAEQAITRLPLDKARKVLTEALAADDPAALIDILERIQTEGEGGVKSATNVRYVIPLLRSLFPQSKTKSRRMTPADLAR